MLSINLVKKKHLSCTVYPQKKRLVENIKKYRNVLIFIFINITLPYYLLHNAVNVFPTWIISPITADKIISQSNKNMQCICC